VSITKSVQTAPHHANWSAAFIMDGRRTAPGDAFRFATELAAKYDLA
jgi:hypothetical protein